MLKERLKNAGSVVGEMKNSLGQCLENSPSSSLKFYGVILGSEAYIRGRVDMGIRSVKECLGKIKK